MRNHICFRRLPVFAAATPCLLLLLSTGCATKKYVGARVAPVDKRVTDLEAKSQKTDASVAGLEQNISRVDERAQSAEKLANDAGSSAARANDAATQSGQKAENAQRAANEAKTLVDQRSSELEQKVGSQIASLDNYQLVGKEVVFFPIGKSILSADSKKQLDAAVSTIMSHKRYVLEVQGFTDKTGTPEMNLELSRKRAQEVVRYLTLEHKIPLFRIHVLGMGYASPVATDKTAAGRKQNRRVEVKLYSADSGDAGKKTSTGGGQ